MLYCSTMYVALYLYVGYTLLTLARVGGAEGYYNHGVCLCQNSSEPMNISTLKILPADFKSNNRLFSVIKL